MNCLCRCICCSCCGTSIGRRSRTGRHAAARAHTNRSADFVIVWVTRALLSRTSGGLSFALGDAYACVGRLLPAAFHAVVFVSYAAALASGLVG